MKSGEEKVVDRYLETIFECDDRTHFAWIDNNIHRKNKKRPKTQSFLSLMADPTGLEPATSSVTGMRSNQLSYGST